MKPVFVLMAVICLVLMLVDRSTQFQCYECWSTDVPGCAVNNFDPSKATKQTCGAGITECQKTIDKVIATGSIEMVYRGCGNSPAIDTKCVNTQNNRINQCRHSCRTELCNGAMTNKSFSMFTALSFLVVAFLARYI